MYQYPDTSGEASMAVTLISAVSENGIIGRAGTLPWKLRSDLRHFKETTMGARLIVGRRTYESLPKGGLPGRTLFVMTRASGPERPNVRFVTSFEQACDIAARSCAAHVFAGGGEKVYEAALPYADFAVITRVHAEVDGDARFPELREEDGWRRVRTSETIQEPGDEYPYHIERWERTTA